MSGLGRWAWWLFCMAAMGLHHCDPLARVPLSTPERANLALCPLPFSLAPGRAQKQLLRHLQGSIGTL